MALRIKGLWVRLLDSWVFKNDLAETYPRQDRTAEAQELAPQRRVNFNAPPGGGVF